MQTIKLVLLCVLVLALLSGAAMADLTLTSAATTAGFSLSTYAYNFPTTGYCCGPLGITFNSGGNYLVADYAGYVYNLSSSDGHNISPVSPSNATYYGSNNAVGLATLGGVHYMTLQASHEIIKVDDNGNQLGVVASGVNFATGIVADTTHNVLWVSDPSTGRIFKYDTSGNLLYTINAAGCNADGLSLNAGATIIYTSCHGFIKGFDTATGTLVFTSATSTGTETDGTAFGSGALAGNIFANDNSGNVWQISLSGGSVTMLANGGSRGDFVAVASDGTLLLTQTSSVLRLTAPQGSGFTNGQVPEPGSMMLFGTGLATLAGGIRRRLRR